jgi:hypothetical protein
METDTIKLIERYLSSYGCLVKDVKFHRELILLSSEVAYNVGANIGAIPGHAFFIGTVGIWTELYDCAVLADKNVIRTNFSTLLYNGVEYSDMDVIQGVNCGLSLLGNGDYAGMKRLYNCGFNKITIDELNLDPAASYMVEIALTGLIFIVI